jgi:Rrf2 family protein
MTNVRFATSIHIMTLLAMQPGEWLASEYIANSININPVLVRKELGNLRKHGLVESREGKNGGSTLAKPAMNILLSDVYRAVQSAHLLGRFNDPNPDCSIGKQINQNIKKLYQDAEEALLHKLSRQSLAEFCSLFN